MTDLKQEDVGTTPHPDNKLTARQAVFHPGSIRYSCHRDGGSYSGSHLMRFTTEAKGTLSPVHAVEACNAFFAAHDNFTVLDMWVHEHEVVVLYTNFMDAEELEDFNHAATELRGLMTKYREDREKALLENASSEEKEAAEQKRLQEVGKKCEQNHGKKAKKAKR